jgi:hypothetical protein
VGDFCYVKTYQLSKAIDYKVGKLSPRWRGPFEIIEQINKNVFKLVDQKTQEILQSNADQLKKAYGKPDFVKPVRIQEDQQDLLLNPNTQLGHRRYNLRQRRP